ncbi:uncharacterized protein G2W53_026658 [Senna tora]|uniref:Uncharacterized protein n=1 Tax=Senna tora TaxID=362788 RepID=A0A834TFF0_9FABA|nr:uncharacterized protein G2W53_026658 [Senna tora]
MRETKIVEERVAGGGGSVDVGVAGDGSL